MKLTDSVHHDKLFDQLIKCFIFYLNYFFWLQKHVFIKQYAFNHEVYAFFLASVYETNVNNS